MAFFIVSRKDQRFVPINTDADKDEAALSQTSKIYLKITIYCTKYVTLLHSESLDTCAVIFRCIIVHRFRSRALFEAELRHQPLLSTRSVSRQNCHPHFRRTLQLHPHPISLCGSCAPAHDHRHLSWIQMMIS